jgi:hypothetical protein
MSVAEWFGITSPLSKYYVRKTVVPGPGPDPNLPSINPIASGRIENDATNRTGNIIGDYTWYRLYNFEGAPNTQGKELRVYLLVCRNVSSDPNASFQLTIPDGGFDPNYSSVTPLNTSMTVKNPGAPGTTTWNFAIDPTFTLVQISTAGNFNPNNQRFFFIFTGI